jgi:ribosomal protein S27E
MTDTPDGVAPATRSMRLRYAGRCRTCQSEQPAGTTAVYDRSSKTVTCPVCAASSPQSSCDPAPDSDDAHRVAGSHSHTPLPPTVSGVAGASAQREYERRKTKRAERIRAAHPRLGGLLLALTDEPQSTKAWATGARGEELLGVRLDGLAGKGVRVLHDRRIPGSKANIDHIAVAPSGVYVIDAKKYQGRPDLRVEGGLLRPRTRKLVVGSRDCTKLVEGVHEQLELVRGALDRSGLDGAPVHGMLCFVQADWPLLGGAFTVDDIAVLWPKKAAQLLTTDGPVDRRVIEAIHRALAVAFPSA